MPQIEHKFERWNSKVHHPNQRCHGSALKYGQCPFLKEEGSDYCIRHGGHHAAKNKKEQALRNYRLTKWKARVGELAESDGIKSLREEVGILRVIMEEMLNKCEDANDLLLYSTRMADLVMKIEKVVVSCDKMEGKMGMLLHRDSVLQLAGEFVTIISEHIDDMSVIDEISMKMVQATMRVQEPNDGRSLVAG